MPRFRVLGLTFLLALMGIGIMAAPASATVPAGFTYQGGTVWRDNNCDDAQGTTNHRYTVKMSRDENGGGPSTTVCSAWDTFCDVPLTANLVAQCDAFGNGGTANDRVSSVYSIWIQNGWDVCLYTSKDFTGTKLRLTNQYADVSALGDLSDKFSSIRPRQEGTAC